MFETSQAEPSSNSKVIVAIVIALFVVGLGGAYYFVFRHADTPAAEAAPSTAPADTPAADLADADPEADLAILSINLRPDTTETQALLDIRISNRSRQFAYSEIEYETSYVDTAGNLISQRTGVLLGALQPGDQQNLTGINDGLFPLGASSYSMEIRAAQASIP